jgi:uncharacterized protein
MPYLIDGHNLIPHVPGLTLQDMDDEMQLIELLQDYCRESRKQVEVFFDSAPPGQLQVRSYGCVMARFIRQGETADQAISRKLSYLGKDARNWTVVSSDRQVQAAAKAARATILTAEAFVHQVFNTLGETSSQSDDSDFSLDAKELDEWKGIFGIDDDE